jgi:energy-coupling factor transporter ATP-binding protein EcfA2
VEIGTFREPVGLGELIVLAGANGSGKSSVLELLSYGIASRYSWQYYQSRQITEHSFAVRIGLTESEVSQLGERPEDADAVTFARSKRGYWMEVNMPDAVPPAERSLNERVHGLASRRFQNFTRKLGFFLRADRGYGARSYDRRRIFDWRNRLAPQHFNNISYAQTTQQYEDMYDFLVEQSYHYVYGLGLHHKNLARGVPTPVPPDPLGPYNKLLGDLFPGYSFVDATAEDLSLKVQLPTGDVLPFQDLSSGEKEVFFILSFFLRNDISDSIIIIDEPELHLHSELARKLLHAMREIKPQNQIWCATHSAELIDEAGRERTFYLRASADRKQAECVPATDEGSEIQILRDLFGYSGYVGISRKIVFSEGRDSSADRRTFANVLPGLSKEIKIIPVGSWENLYRMNGAILALLESDFARCEFFLIRDRDYLTNEAVKKHLARSQGRLFVLSRYHIENFLLDEVLISTVLRDLYQINISPDHVRRQLFDAALQNSAAFLRDMAASRFGELFQAEDCCIGNHSNGLNMLTRDGGLDDAVVAPLRKALSEKVDLVYAELRGRVNEEKLKSLLDQCMDEVRASLRLEQDGWKALFPGRYLLQKFSSAHGLGKWPALQNVLIDRLSRGDIPANEELRGIFSVITATPTEPNRGMQATASGGA